MSIRPAYIHHVNFPSTDLDRTRQWYEKVFGHEVREAQEQHQRAC